VTLNPSEVNAPPPDAGGELAGRLRRMAALLASERYPGSDRAALKRYAPGQPVPLAFHRLWLRHLNDEIPSESTTPAWALLAWGLAGGGANAHRAARPLGRCLAECGYSEARLERLLATADDDTRLALAAAMARFVAAKGDSFDWAELARLLLTRDDEARERLHRRIATDYYRHLPRTETE
jgi:CRISPR system Cascade subunit CasB